MTRRCNNASFGLLPNSPSDSSCLCWSGRIGTNCTLVYQAWTNWVLDEAIAVNKPAAHFMQFIKTHDPMRRS